MDATGAQECLLTQLQPADLWRESGRWETYTKAEGIMFSLVDRRGARTGPRPHPRRGDYHHRPGDDSLLPAAAPAPVPDSNQVS